MKIVTVLVFVFACSTYGWSQSASENRLARQVGHWRIEEKYAGDPATYVKQSTCELFPGGEHLVCRADAKTPLGDAKSLSVLSYEATQRNFTMYTVTSIGVAVLVRGTASDTAWNGETTFPFNDTSVTARVTITDESAASWSYRMEAVLGGARTVLIQEARAVRVQP